MLENSQKKNETKVRLSLQEGEELYNSLVEAYKVYHGDNNEMLSKLKSDESFFNQVKKDSEELFEDLKEISPSWLKKVFRQKDESKRRYSTAYLDKLTILRKKYLRGHSSRQDEERVPIELDENTSISGTTLIDHTFRKRINQAESFTHSQFYTAKQNDSCQWFGVINDYDIPRKEYTPLLEILKNSFNDSRTYKVGAVVYGNGGAGKSTLLRRLAVDLINSEFHILWVNERQFSTLSNEGLDQIRNLSEMNFIIFIEDWYRLVNSIIGEKDEIVRDFLEKTRQIENLRIIIGDRQIVGKVYLYNLYNPDNLIELGVGDNRKIIKEVLRKNPIWKTTAKSIFRKRRDYRSTLFLLLFTLARSYEESRTDLSEPTTAFRDIIRSDMKRLEAEYPGLAKMLFYWASIYEKSKFFISYSSFLKLADSLNGDSKVSEHFFNLNSDSEIHNILRLYINVGIDEEQKVEEDRNILFIQFNHDILADLGISKIRSENLGVFDDLVKRNMITNLLPLEKEDYSNYHLLLHFFLHEAGVFIDENEKYNIMDKFDDAMTTGYRSTHSVKIIATMVQGNQILQEKLKER